MTPSDTPVVLVVEDDPPVREFLDEVLDEEGYEVIVAHDGTMALRIIESLKVDLITLDLDLPGLTGSELLQVLRKRKAAIPPVVVITGQIPVRKQTRQMAQAVITKPFDVDDLIAAVLSLLPRSRMAAERMKQAGGSELNVTDGAEPSHSQMGSGDDSSEYVKAKRKRPVKKADHALNGKPELKRTEEPSNTDTNAEA